MFSEVFQCFHLFQLLPFKTEKPKVIGSSKSNSKWYANVLLDFSGPFHTAWDPLHGYQPKMVSRVRRKHPICNCVHSYSISPCQTPFKNMSFATITKPWMATELTKTLHTVARCPLLCPGTRSRPGRVYLRKECVYISVQRVQYSDTKCEGFFTSACNKGKRTRLHAGCLFHWCRIHWFPLLIKQNSFLCGHTKLSGMLYT